MGKQEKTNKELKMKTSHKILCILTVCLATVRFSDAQTGSVYTQRPDDPEAFYFTPENYNIKADRKTDVSDELQAAINRLKTEKAFGILFIPEGKYLIST